MSLNTQHNGKVFEITLGNRFDFNMVREFREAYESVIENKINVIVINFANTNFIDSSALGLLINMEKFYKTQNVTIQLINCSDQIERILLIARFDKKFEIIRKAPSSKSA